MCRTVFKINITCKVPNVTQMYVNCGFHVCCSASKVEIFSLAFKWLIILGSLSSAEAP